MWEMVLDKVLNVDQLIKKKRKKKDCSMIKRCCLCKQGLGIGADECCYICVFHYLGDLSSSTLGRDVLFSWHSGSMGSNPK